MRKKGEREKTRYTQTKRRAPIYMWEADLMNRSHSPYAASILKLFHLRLCIFCVVLFVSLSSVAFCFAFNPFENTVCVFFVVYFVFTFSTPLSSCFTIFQLLVPLFVDIHRLAHSTSTISRFFSLHVYFYLIISIRCFTSIDFLHGGYCFAVHHSLLFTFFLSHHRFFFHKMTEMMKTTEW